MPTKIDTALEERIVTAVSTSLEKQFGEFLATAEAAFEHYEERIEKLEVALDSARKAFRELRAQVHTNSTAPVASKKQPPLVRIPRDDYFKAKDELIAAGKPCSAREVVAYHRAQAKARARGHEVPTPEDFAPDEIPDDFPI